MKHLQQLRSAQEHLQGLATQMPAGTKLTVVTTGDCLLCVSLTETGNQIIAEQTFDFSQKEAHDSAMQFAVKHVYARAIVGDMQLQVAA